VETSDARLERLLDGAHALGSGSTADDVARVLAAHEDVLDAANAGEVTRAVDLVVDALSCGGRLVQVGAGTSGWLAALDAAETIVTFGMRGRVTWVVAGGSVLDPTVMSLGDDDADSARHDPVLAELTAADVVLAVSASGRTPYTVAAVDVARERGARVVVLVNAEGSPLALRADATVCVPVAGELIGGSTRLTAGLAQKLVLNAISTISMVRLGRAVAGQMVCVEPLNDKLRARAVAAIAAATGASTEQVTATLADAGGAGDLATVALLAGVGIDDATARLDRAGGDILAAAILDP
jgi:N-acetylmuramic acid 6-phosphate etherase